MPRARNVCALAFAAYLLWTRLGRRSTARPSDARILLQQAFGLNRDRGNVVGIQPYMTPADYSSASAFYAKLDAYLQSAAANGWLNQKTVIVLPEYVGTWLLLAGEKKEAGSVPSILLAILIVIASNPIRFLICYLRSERIVRSALFRLNATSVAAIYHNTFSALAYKYGVTISAGSVLLPSPQVVGSCLVVKDIYAPLENVSVLYRPDGLPDPQVVRKVHVVPEEAIFTKGCHLGSSLPVYDTPIGRLGVLVCADTWYPDTFAELKRQNCQVVVAGAYVYPRGAMIAPWQGYLPLQSHPADVPQGAIRNISEEEAWQQFAMSGRAPGAGIANGMTVFLQGQMWELTGEGRVLLHREGRPLAADNVAAGASLVNMWL